MASSLQKKMIILMVTLFITITSFGITGPVIPAYLESINQGGMASGMIIAIFAGAQLLFAPLGGKWTDQFGRRKMIIIGLMLITAGGFLFYLTDTLWVLYASRVISGIGDAFLIPAVYAYTADITSVEQRAKGTGLVAASMSMGACGRAGNHVVHVRVQCESTVSIVCFLYLDGVLVFNRLLERK